MSGAFTTAFASSFNITNSTVPVSGYASVADFEIRTGQDVPADKQDALQVRLNDNSALFRLYMGDCADEVEAAYGDLLTSLVVNRTNRQIQQPAGMASASVGSTSVTYRGTGEGTWLGPEDTEILDRLMLACCGPSTDVPGVGELGVGWGGPPPAEDVQTMWVLTGPPRRLP